MRFITFRPASVLGLARIENYWLMILQEAGSVQREVKAFVVNGNGELHQ